MTAVTCAGNHGSPRRLHAHAPVAGTVVTEFVETAILLIAVVGGSHGPAGRPPQKEWVKALVATHPVSAS